MVLGGLAIRARERARDWDLAFWPTDVTPLQGLLCGSPVTQGFALGYNVAPHSGLPE